MKTTPPKNIEKITTNKPHRIEIDIFENIKKLLGNTEHTLHLIFHNDGLFEIQFLKDERWITKCAWNKQQLLGAIKKIIKLNKKDDKLETIK